MLDFNDHKNCLRWLEEAQAADKDNREMAKEAHLFISKRNGQWEDHYWNSCNGRPRYTFDQTTPIVDQIAGDIEQSDFDIKCKPAGHGANKDLAELRDGLIRDIENISGAKSIYSNAGRNVATTGIDGWMVVNDYYDETSFDQDLIVKPIHNYVSRVWFMAGSLEQDHSDAKCAWLLSAIPTNEYKERFKNGSGLSVDDAQEDTAYYDKAENIVIGHFFYKKPEPRELVMMSDGAVYEVNEEYEAKVSELSANGVTEKDRRTVNVNKVYVRKFDGGGWLEESQETPFDIIPLVAAYGNYKVIENKIIYHGVVEKLMDPQRVLNYSLSREIEEGAMAPRKKIWLTDKMVGGRSNEIANLNNSAAPVQLYTPDPDQPNGPLETGGAQINPGLRVISDGMQQIMGRTAGIFAAGMGDNPNAQSGVAIDKLQDKSNNITVKYFRPLEIAIAHTAKIINGAIPKVYDTTRQKRLVYQDGTDEIKTLNDVEGLHDLSVGKYEISCTAGPSYHSRKQETVQGIISLAGIDPDIIKLGEDVLLNNIDTPGIDKIAERARAQLFKAGLIPVEQMTEEELMLYQQAQMQPPPEDPNMVLAKAEQAKAEVQLMGKQMEMQAKQAELAMKEVDLNLKREKLMLDAQKQEIEFMEKMNNANLAADKQALEEIKASFDMRQREMKEASDRLAQDANTLKTLREAMGVNTIVGPQGMNGYVNQSDVVDTSQTIYRSEIN